MRAAGLVDASGLIGSAEQTGTDRARSRRAAPTPTACTATSSSPRATSAPSSSAKSALYAGARLLMDELGTDTVDRIVLAGAFGAHISPRHAMILGMIPDCDLARVSSAGNAAGTGARIALLNVAARREVEDARHPHPQGRDRHRAALPGALRRRQRHPARDRRLPAPRPAAGRQLQRRPRPPAAARLDQRRSGGTSRSRADSAAMLARSWLRPHPLRRRRPHAPATAPAAIPAGRIGRGTKPPPQFGQTL